MIRRMIFGVVLALLWTGRTEAGYWSEDFESLPAGAVTGNPGWEYLPSGPVILAAQVSTNRPYDGIKSLRLPSAGGIFPRALGVYTNVHFAPADGSNWIVRLSAWLYRDARNQDITIALGSNNVPKLWVGTASNGNVTVNGQDLGVPYVTGRYAQVSLHYDVALHKFALDYDLQRVADWVDAPGSPVRDFDRVWFDRKPFETDTGFVYIDNVSVEAIPSDVWFWWRMNEGLAGPGTATNGLFVDTTGRLRPTSRAYFAGQETPPWPAVFAHSNVAENASALRAPFVQQTNSFNFVVRDNFTLEAVFKIQPTTSPDIIRFFKAGDTTDTGNSHIELRILNEPSTIIGVYGDAGGQQLMVHSNLNLRDGQWHHLAFTKVAAVTQLYVDYDLVNSWALNPGNDGGVDFSPGALFVAGNNTAVMTNVTIDEVRFTADQIWPPNKFLRLGRTKIESCMPAAGGTGLVVRAQIQGGTGFSNQLTFAASPTNATWTRMGTLRSSAGGGVARDGEATIPWPTNRTGVLRVDIK